MKKRAKDLVAEIREYCRANANPAQADKWARYFTEGYDSWGLLDKNNPFFNTKKAEWIERYASLGVSGFLDAGAELCASGKFEEASISIAFLKEHRGGVDDTTLGQLDRWFKGGIRNWAHVDVLCGEVLSPAFSDGQFQLASLGKWRDSEWKYQRRASVVALIPALKGTANIAALLDYVRPLMQDSEKPVQQAVGWFLREAWKISPKPVESFLLEYVETAPRQIYQTATEKMSPEKKARFKRPAKKLR